MSMFPDLSRGFELMQQLVDSLHRVEQALEQHGHKLDQVNKNLQELCMKSTPRPIQIPPPLISNTFPSNNGDHPDFPVQLKDGKSDARG